MSKSVFCIATSYSQADRIVSRLQEAGFPNSDISVLAPDHAGTGDFGHVKSTKASEGIAAGAQERNQNCQRKRFVAAFRCLIEFNRQLRLSRERALPLAILVQDPTKFPLRQFERDQGEYGVDAGTGFDQPSDPAC